MPSLGDLLPCRVVDLALQPGEARVAVAEFFLDVGQRQAEQLGQLALLLARGLTSFGIAHTEGTGTLVASNAPWRSVMRPRLACSSCWCR